MTKLIFKDVFSPRLQMLDSLLVGSRDQSRLHYVTHYPTICHFFLRPRSLLLSPSRLAIFITPIKSHSSFPLSLPFPSL